MSKRSYVTNSTRKLTKTEIYKWSSIYKDRVRLLINTVPIFKKRGLSQLKVNIEIEIIIFVIQRGYISIELV